MNADAYPDTVVPHIGTEVTGDKRFPRPALEAEFDSAMTRTNGARLFGLRRIGKSSEAAACCERLRAAGYLVVKEDAEGMSSEVDLLRAVLRGLPADGLYARALQFISQDNAITKAAREAITQATGGKPEDLLAYFGPLMTAVEKAIEGNERVALVIDEFPWLCRSILEGDAAKGKARVDTLLAALRRWRGKGMRMLLMGSIGMHALGRQYGLDLDHLNDLNRLDLPPFEPEEARALVNALVKGGKIAGWTEAHTAALLDETVAFYPALLQKGFEQTTLGGRAARLERFPDLFAEKVRPDFDDTYYQQFDKRLAHYRNLPSPLPVLLESALSAVMGGAGPTAREALHDRVARGGELSEADLGNALDILREDGFLAVRAQRDGSQHWRVASGLVQAWWTQRRGRSRP